MSGILDNFLFGKPEKKVSAQHSLVSLTSAGRKKAENYSLEGSQGDILNYLLRAQPASITDIAQNTGQDTRTIRSICTQWARSNPPLVVIGGGR